MTTQILVGQAAVQVRAVGTQFTSDINRVVTPGLSAVAAQTEGVAYRGTRAFGNMWSAFSASSQGALAPVAGIVTSVQMAANSLERGASRFARAGVAGAAGVGIGAGLQIFASKEQAARQQLDATLATMGQSYDQFGHIFDQAIGRGEHFGKLSYETLDALNRLTMATHNPTKAVAAYNLALNMSATRHIALDAAVQSLVTAFAGNTRMFKQYGIDVTSQTKAVKAATAADAAHKTAIDKVKVAKQNLRDEEARIAYARSHGASSASALASAEASLAAGQATEATTRFSHGSASPQYAAALARVNAAEVRLAAVRQKATAGDGLSASQQIALRKAHEAVAAAEKKVTQTAKDQTTAHKDAKGAAHSLDDAIGQLTHRLSGQADAAANTFTGRLKAIGAVIEDDAARFGAKYGPALTAISTGVLAVSTLAEGGMAIFSRFSSSGRAVVAMNKVFAETTASEVAAINASTEAEMTLMQAQATTAEAEIATSSEAAAAATSEAWTAAGATVDAELAGMASAGIASAEEVSVAWTAADARITASMAATSVATDAEFAGMAAAGEGAALASSVGWAGMLSKANIGLAAFAASYMATSELLKHTPLGGYVTSAANHVRDFLGFGPNTDPYKNLSPSDAAPSSGPYKGYVFGPKGYFTPDGKEHKWKNAPKSMYREKDYWTQQPQSNAPTFQQLLTDPIPHQRPGHGDGHGGMNTPPTHPPAPHGAATRESGVIGEVRALRMDVLRIVRAAEKQLTATEDLGKHHGHKHDPTVSNPSLATLF